MSDEVGRILRRLEDVLHERPVLFGKRARFQPRSRGADEPAGTPQPSFWWSDALAPQPEFVRRSEELCRRIEFGAISIHRLATFARVRYRIPQRAAGVFLSAQVVDCPLAGMHCDGAFCLLSADGMYSAVRWFTRTAQHEVAVN